MSLSKAREREVSTDPSGPVSAPCAGCRRDTAVRTLSDFGGMCVACFREKISRPLPESPDIGDKAKNGERDWANALRRREMRGERLTLFQRDAWRVALGRVDGGTQ